MARLIGSICLSDIPQEEMYEYNGKIYVKVFIDKSSKPTRYANGDIKMDHYIKVNKNRDEGKEGVNYFIGNLKGYETQSGNSASSPSSARADLMARIKIGEQNEIY